MNPDLLLAIAFAVLAGLVVATVVCTAPGFGPVAYAAAVDWLARHGHAAIAWRMRRVAARHYHRHGRDGVHHHIRPTVAGRSRALARRVLSLRLRRPVTPVVPVPADTVPWELATTRPDIRQFVRPTC